MNIPPDAPAPSRLEAAYWLRELAELLPGEQDKIRLHVIADCIVGRRSFARKSGMLDPGQEAQVRYAAGLVERDRSRETSPWTKRSTQQ